MERYERIESSKEVKINILFVMPLLILVSAVLIFIVMFSQTNWYVLLIILLVTCMFIIFFIVRKLEVWYINDEEVIVQNHFKLIKRLNMESVTKVDIVTKFTKFWPSSTMMYVINDFENQYKIRATEINPTKYPEIKYFSGFNKKNGPLLIPVNEITRKYLEKYIKK